MNRLVSRLPAPGEHEQTARIAVLPIGTAGPDDHLPPAGDALAACAISAELSRNFPLLVLPPLTILDPGLVTISRALPALLSGIYESVSRSETRALVMVSAHGDRHLFASVARDAGARGMRMALFPTAEDWTSARRSARYATIRHRETTDSATLVLRSLVLRFRNVRALLASTGRDGD